jgi:HAD superfamily hydrolase (TIGR01493 family)
MEPIIEMINGEPLEIERIRVVAFDLFGTIFDLRSYSTKEELQGYADHLKQPYWSPLKLPKRWEDMPAFEDSIQGIFELRMKFFTVTCSNAPLGLSIRMCKNADIEFDGVIPLELNKVFKTNPKAYMTVCEVMDVQPENVLMVTANKSFGDIEASRSVGMQSVLIRGESEIQTIPELAGRIR